jgi:hypothetical protein
LIFCSLLSNFHHLLQGWLVRETCPKLRGEWERENWLLSNTISVCDAISHPLQNHLSPKHAPNSDATGWLDVVMKTVYSHKFPLPKVMRSSKALQDVSEIAVREERGLCGIICILKATHI